MKYNLCYPEIHIKNCRTGNNRPRGFLLNSNKKTIVEGCTFYNSSSAIAINGDNSYWFEATGVRDVTIENNIFDNCGYHDSDYSILVKAYIKENPDIEDYHSGIKVKNNLFKTFSGGCVYVANCKDCSFENNVVEKNVCIPVKGVTRGGEIRGEVINFLYRGRTARRVLRLGSRRPVRRGDISRDNLA